MGGRQGIGDQLATHSHGQVRDSPQATSESMFYQFPQLLSIGTQRQGSTHYWFTSQHVVRQKVDLYVTSCHCKSSFFIT